MVAREASNPISKPWPGLLFLATVATLIGLWLVLIRRVGSSELAVGHLWVIGASWGLPLVVGPPLFSTDVYSYAAQGLLLTHHLDPYHVGPAALGRAPAALAVDLRWRTAPSPYGPLATLIEWTAAEIGGGALGALVVFRGIAVRARRS